MFTRKKIGFFVSMMLLIVLAGCITVQMPQYVKDKNPYRKEFYADYNKTVLATTEALMKLGWKIVKEENPAVFESDSVTGPKEPRQVLIFTNVRQSSMLLSSRYTTINVLVKEDNEKANVEIRYFSILSTMLRNFESYENDSFVDKIFTEIDKIINEEKLGDLVPETQPSTK